MADLTVCCGLAGSSLEERLDQLRWALARLPLAGDQEAVHDTRVALRRLREACRGFQECLRPSDRERAGQLRRAERELGSLRDAEVRLQLLDQVLGPVAVWSDRSDDPLVSPHYGSSVVVEEPRRLRPGLRGLEMEARRQLADVTSAQIESARAVATTAEMTERLQALAAPLRLHSGHRRTRPAAMLAEEQLPRLFKRVSSPRGSGDRLHRRRIDIRRLRYRLELFSVVLPPGHRAVLQQLRQTQSLLGRYHDLDVIASWIDDGARRHRHELRPALRRLVVRFELEQQTARELASADLDRLDSAGWWEAARGACLR